MTNKKCAAVCERPGLARAVLGAAIRYRRNWHRCLGLAFSMCDAAGERGAVRQRVVAISEDPPGWVEVPATPCPGGCGKDALLDAWLPIRQDFRKQLQELRGIIEGLARGVDMAALPASTRRKVAVQLDALRQSRETTGKEPGSGS